MCCVAPQLPNLDRSKLCWSASVPTEEVRILSAPQYCADLLIIQDRGLKSSRQNVPAAVCLRLCSRLLATHSKFWRMPVTCHALRLQMCAHCLLQNGCIQHTPRTTYTLYSIHQAQQQPLATSFCTSVALVKALWGSLRLLSFDSLQQCIAALRHHRRDCNQIYSQCCVCAEAGASDLHQAHLLPLSAAAAKPALTAKRPHHVVDSHSACHIGRWRAACNPGGCCHHTCLGQPCRSSNSHSEHRRRARYAALCKPRCVSVCDKLLGSLEGGNRYACGSSQRKKLSYRPAGHCTG